MTSNSLNSHSIILAPVFSEKSTSLTPLNQYTFRVEPTATKHQIKAAIRQLYNVDVIKITTTNRHASQKRSLKTGKYYRVAGYKKTVVEIKKGQKIELFTALEK